MNELNLVTNENGKAMTTSLKIAEVFGKEHKDVLKKIREKANLFNERNFSPVDYLDSKGETRPMYLLDRDFTTFLIMGFTGSKADEFKMKYIEAFNKMEETIKNGLVPDERTLSVMAVMNAVDDMSRVVALKNFEDCVKKPLLATIEEQKPKCEYHDTVLNKPDLITTTVIAKDLGLKSAQKLNDILKYNKIIFKQKNGTWCPYANKDWLIQEGYCDYQSYETKHAAQSLKWTEKGRKWIVEHFAEWKDNYERQNVRPIGTFALLC